MRTDDGDQGCCCDGHPVVPPSTRQPPHGVLLWDEGGLQLPPLLNLSLGVQLQHQEPALATDRNDPGAGGVGADLEVRVFILSWSISISSQQLFFSENSIYCASAVATVDFSVGSLPKF